MSRKNLHSHPIFLILFLFELFVFWGHPSTTLQIDTKRSTHSLH